MEHLKIERQIALEEEMRGLGLTRYVKNMTAGEEAELPPGMIIMRKAVKPFGDHVQGWIDTIQAGNARQMATIVKILDKVGSHECAYITLRRAVGAIALRQKTTSLALAIATDLEDELEYRAFKKANPDAFKRVIKYVKDASSAEYRRLVMHNIRRKEGVSDLAWTKEEKMRIGVKLLDLCIESTGMFESTNVLEGKNRTVAYLMGTQKMREWLANQHTRCQLLSPVFLPMVCKPNDWTSPKVGGYMTVKLDMVKTPNKNYLDELAGVDMPLVYGSLNALQGTAWRINKRIHSVMSDLWELGGDRAGLPAKDGKDVPNKPLDVDTNEVALKEWKKKAKRVHNFNHRNMSKIAGVGQKLFVANKFLDEEELFYVWTLDWRGRAYPIGTFVHPQADDSGKALLEFANGKALGSEGAAWLGVQLANTWGNDKVSFSDRIQWAEDNTDMILRCANDPLANKDWMDADAPFGFLAACFEWQGYCANGINHVCNLPIQVDGSCNGLQNFSAMLRDEIGGAATNLIPSELPKDIYGLVAKAANGIAHRDYHVHSIPEAEVFLKQPITRKLTKRNTMTQPYSVSLYGMKDQILEEFRKMNEEGKGLNYLECEEFKVASYLAKANYEAIGTVVVAAVQVMDWLKEVAKIAASDDLPVVWTNPAGLPVQQCYMETAGKKSTLYFQGKRTDFWLQVTGKNLDGRKQSAGIAPNFVHSCDSGHMMRTIVKCVEEEGISDFSFIHDSFGTHASDMGTLSCILREAFVEQYQGDVLERFRDELVEQLGRSGSDELVKQIPPLPPRGTLDLELVKQSEYFFA